jgi:hypothetical protein
MLTHGLSIAGCFCIAARRITVNNRTGLDIDVVPAAGVAGAAAHDNTAHVSLANFFAKKVGGLICLIDDSLAWQTRTPGAAKQTISPLHYACNFTHATVSLIGGCRCEWLQAQHNNSATTGQLTPSQHKACESSWAPTLSVRQARHACLTVRFAAPAAAAAAAACRQPSTGLMQCCYQTSDFQLALPPKPLPLLLSPPKQTRGPLLQALAGA